MTSSCSTYKNKSDNQNQGPLQKCTISINLEVPLMLNILCDQHKDAKNSKIKLNNGKKGKILNQDPNKFGGSCSNIATNLKACNGTLGATTKTKMN